MKLCWLRLSKIERYKVFTLIWNLSFVDPTTQVKHLRLGYVLDGACLHRLMVISFFFKQTTLMCPVENVYIFLLQILSKKREKWIFVSTFCSRKGTIRGDKIDFGKKEKIWFISNLNNGIYIPVNGIANSRFKYLF